MDYYTSTIVDESFKDAVLKTRDAITSNGFTVVSELDLKEKFREKLNIDYSNYLILGVCMPKYAHSALEYDPYIGVLLPCNIIIRETADSKVEVFSINPQDTMLALQINGISELANEIQSKLVSIISSL